MRIVYFGNHVSRLANSKTDYSFRNLLLQGNVIKESKKVKAYSKNPIGI